MSTLQHLCDNISRGWLVGNNELYFTPLQWPVVEMSLSPSDLARVQSCVVDSRGIPEGHAVALTVKMLCTTELDSAGRTEDLLNIYGSFGLAMAPQWARRVGLRPVVYTSDDLHFLRCLEAQLRCEASDPLAVLSCTQVPRDKMELEWRLYWPPERDSEGRIPFEITDVEHAYVKRTEDVPEVERSLRALCVASGGGRQIPRVEVLPAPPDLGVDELSAIPRSSIDTPRCKKQVRPQLDIDPNPAVDRSRELNPCPGRIHGSAG